MRKGLATIVGAVILAVGLIVSAVIVADSDDNNGKDKTVQLANANDKKGDSKKTDGQTGGYGFITAYAASKHGVIGLTRSLAAELGSLGHPEITVNATCPGYVRAGMGIKPQKVKDREGRITEIPGDELCERDLKRRVPQRRMLEAEEVANVAVFLALPETRGMTGQALNIDGGFLMS